MLLFLHSVCDEDNRDKVEAIYRKYHIEMYKIAKYKLRGRPNASSEAEEALQNAFIKIIEYFDKIRFEESEARLRAYFLAIVTNEAINLLSKNSEPLCIHEMEDELLSDEDFVERLCLKSDYNRVVQAITALDDRYSIPLQLRFVNDLSVNEIADLLDLNVKTVYTHISRGKAKLIRRLKKGEPL